MRFRCAAAMPFMFVPFTFLHTAEADILTTQRAIDTTVTFADSATFADAFANTINTETVAPGSFGTDTETGGYAALNTGITYFATGGVSITPSSVPPETGYVTTTVNVTGAGTWGFREGAPVYNGRLAGLDYLPSPLARFNYNGFYTLEVFIPSNGFLDTGGTWLTNIYLPGDWSTEGTFGQTGTHLLYSLDPLWTITNNFVYNPLTNQTVFSVLNSNYPGVDAYDNGPYPVIILTGDPVPEPASFCLLGCAGLVLAGLRIFQLRRNRGLFNHPASKAYGQTVN